MYFKYSRKTGDDYIHYLLDDYFSPKRVLKQVDVSVKIEEVREKREESLDEIEEESIQVIAKENVGGLEIKHISDSAESIQKASSYWFDTFNPDGNIRLSSEEQKWIDRLNRLGMGYFRPLVMSSFLCKNVTKEQRVNLFQTIERYVFIAFRITQVRSNYGNSEFYNSSRDLYY